MSDTNDTIVLNNYVDQLCKHYGTKLTIQNNTNDKVDIILIPHQATTVSVDHGETGDGLLIKDEAIYNAIISHNKSRIPIRHGSTIQRQNSTKRLNKYLKYKQKYLALKNQLNN